MKKIAIITLTGSLLASVPAAAYMGPPVFMGAPMVPIPQQQFMQPMIPPGFLPMMPPMFPGFMPMMPMNSMPAFGAPAMMGMMQQRMFGSGVMPYNPKWWVPPAS
jgi:hypothetical protein